jgi:hypothetical protein
MGQPQTPRNHAPLENFPLLTNNIIQQTNETQNIKQPDRPPFYYRDTNSDEELMENEEEIQNGKQHTWQNVTKKRKLTTATKRIQDNTAQTTTSNRFQVLANINTEIPKQVNNPINHTKQDQPKDPKPPPIFIYGVTNYTQKIENISQRADPEVYHTKTFPDNTVKINTYQPETYRKLIRHLKEEQIIHHSYQLKQERAYRVVIRNLHQSTPTTDIISELGSKGHKVRNVTNVRGRQTKDPLPLFFVDLESQDNNKDIYNIDFIETTKIRIEPPRHKRDIVQCLRCQSYEHTRKYCMKTFNCVKCAGPHDTKYCSKPKDTPATCVLCKGAHPANYKGCTTYSNHK